MKISQLRQIIREEIQKLRQPKMPIRLKELINVDPKAWKPKVSTDRYGNEVRKFPQSAANDMKRILDKVTGGNSVADINSDTGGIIYNLPNNDDRMITMGIDEKGEFSVQAEDIGDYSIFDKTSKTFKTPKEAMAYAAKLTKDYNN